MTLVKVKNKLLIIAFLVMAFVLVGGNYVNAEWQEPDEPPAQKDFYAPITTTNEPQAKEGYLLLDPENYDSSDAGSLNFSITKPLVVYGNGSRFSTDDVYFDKLIVDTDTLYADSGLQWVGIGTTGQINNERLNVVGGTTYFGTSTNPISGRALNSYSDDNFGIYADAADSAAAGIYGLNTASQGIALYGESLGNNVGIRGESTDGVGIWAETDSTTYGAIFGSNDSSGFAGYFDGRLGSVGDMIAENFLPANLQRSLIPYSSGQLLESFSVPTSNSAIATDGNYIYLGSSSPINSMNLFKISKQDGSVVKSFSATGWGIEDIEYDGKYLVMLGDLGGIIRFDPLTETLVELSGSTTGLQGNYPQDADPLTIGTINGETYVWVPNSTTNTLIRVKISDLSQGNASHYDEINLNSGIVEPYGVVFDGQYIWVASRGSNNIARIWADLDDPNGYINHPGIVIDTMSNGMTCGARDVYFDGVYIWCLTDSNMINYMARIWAEDPYDTQHPAISVGGDLDKLSGMTFDGTYYWVAAHLTAPSMGLYRILAADPTVFELIDPNIKSQKVIFDGTYLWLLDEVTTTLKKYYSGTGMGNTDLSSVVNLQSQIGECSVSSEQCIYDWNCPVSETCSAGNQIQIGSMFVSDNIEVRKDHCYDPNTTTHLYDSDCISDADCSGSEECVGGDMRVGGDIQITNNLWGGICEDGITYCTSNADCTVACYGGTVPVVGGVASCDDGDYMSGVEVGASGEIVNIYCWEI